MEASASRSGATQQLTPCDLVMKGGVTSGIVYPGAIAELSRRYRFKGIGGSSAGAIGALGAAAAELGRYRRGDDSSFEQVADLARRLSEDEDIIGSLFQPDAVTRQVFNAIVALADAGLDERETVVGKYLTALRAALPHFPGAAALGGLIAALPGALFVVPAARLVAGGGWGDVIYLVIVCALTLLGVIAGATIGMLYRAQRSFRVDVKDNFWGMCSGLTDPANADRPALTDWMIELVDELAGPKPVDAPVTFGDLWYADRSDEYRKGEQPVGAPSARAIDLQVITTCLSDGRPYRFPFQPEEDQRQQFFFRPDDFRRLFPESFVDWLVEHPAEGLEPEEDYHPLPAPADLPIAMAARLSLSFPGLLSAIPLYRRRSEGRFEECWFSDGGIASNFPIHFFDSPVPRWPTLAISLAGPPAEPCAEEDWRDHRAICQVNSIRLHANPRRRLENVTGFGSAIFYTARNWADNMQADLPGYRDRIISVNMNPGEGGLNLNMPRVIRERLSERGALAGAQLRDRFHLPDDDGIRPTSLWSQHRWTRYRSSMAVIQAFLGAFHRGYTYDLADPSYKELIERGLTEPQFPWRDAEHLNRAHDATADLDALATNWSGPGDPEFSVGAPRPRPEVRIRPRI